MNTIHTVLVGCSLFLIAGCSKKADPAAPKGEAPKVEAPKVEAPKAPVALAADLVTKLEKADKVDGKADKVVSKCTGCELKMDGVATHSAKLGDYTLQFCDHCADKAKDAEKVFTALKLPN